MKKVFLAVALSMFLMFSVAGCGGSGGSGSSEGDNNTIPVGTADGSVKIAWDAPINSDGTPLSNIAGYNVHYGTSSRNYDKKVDTGTLQNCTITGLTPGTYYMSVTCYDASGNESAFSNEASKIVQ
jgi:hypothetical protein